MRGRISITSVVCVCVCVCVNAVKVVDAETYYCVCVCVCVCVCARACIAVPDFSATAGYRRGEGGCSVDGVPDDARVIVQANFVGKRIKRNMRLTSRARDRGLSRTLATLWDRMTR